MHLPSGAATIASFALVLSFFSSTAVDGKSTGGPSTLAASTSKASTNLTHGNSTVIEEIDEVVIVEKEYVRMEPEEPGDMIDSLQYALALLSMLVAITAMGLFFFMCPDGWNIASFMEEENGQYSGTRGGGDRGRRSHKKKDSVRKDAEKATAAAAPVAQSDDKPPTGRSSKRATKSSAVTDWRTTKEKLSMKTMTGLANPPTAKSSARSKYKSAASKATDVKPATMSTALSHN